MKRLLIVLLFFLPLLAWAQTKPTAPLQPEESKARLQQLGDSLRKYNGFENFDRHGWMVVWKTVQGGDYSYGVINDRGQTVLPCEYDCIRFQEHSDLIMVMKDNLAGFMNRHLEWVIPQKYNGETWCSLECDDLFQYGMVVMTDTAGKHGVVDSTGRIILPCKYDWVEIVEPDLFLIEEGNKGGAVNQREDIVIPFVYTHLRYLGDHYIEAKKQSLYSVISTKGHEILPFVYEHIYDYDNGRFAVKQDGKWGVVDSLGNIIVLFQNAKWMYFEKGMDIIVKLLDDGSEELLDLKGNVLAKSDMSVSAPSGESIAVFKQKKILDEEKIIMACFIYDRNWNKIDEFDEILYDEVDLINDITMIPVKRNGKWGFVNRDFQLIVPCVYASPVEGDCGYGTVTTADQQKMLINEQGEMLVKGPYKWMIPSINDWFKVCFVSPDERVAIQGFIDRYGNNTFTEEELKLIQKLHLQEMLEEDYGDRFLVQYAHEMPEFPGGVDSLYAYLNRNMHFPEEVKAKGLSGKVVAQFVVETDGSVNEVVIIEHFHALCDEEVIRILQQMPAWNPGKNSDGKPIRCYFQIPIKFTAEKEEEGER
jgi:TonB family protein